MKQLDNKQEAKYIIVGAGLSGLCTAYTLMEQGETDFLVLEGRQEAGGRIHTKEDVDLGATWFQDHHKYLNQLLQKLDIQKFEQFNKGQNVLVYHTMAPAHYFETQEGAPKAHRMVGGSRALIKKLEETLDNKVTKDVQVVSFTETQAGIEIKTSKGSYTGSKVVVTIPPKLAVSLHYAPELPATLRQAMKGTHTWMSNAIKVGLLFESPFWRNKKLSGTVIGQVGPVTELYDHCNASMEQFALMGFVNEGLRDVSLEERKERILAYLETYLGKEIQSYTTYFEKDWALEKFTSCKPLKSVYMSPRYGDPAYENFKMNGKLLFSGTETSPVYGGYLDGAVYSGLRAAHLLLGKKIQHI